MMGYSICYNKQLLIRLPADAATIYLTFLRLEILLCAPLSLKENTGLKPLLITNLLLNFDEILGADYRGVILATSYTQSTFKSYQKHFFVYVSFIDILVNSV